MRLSRFSVLFGAVAAAVIDTETKPIPSTLETYTIPELTTANHKTETAKGFWFVKYYSPHCSHCKALAPFWEKAGEKYQSYAKLHDFHLGSVDCTVNGDLCSEKGIRGYPTLFLYQDGEKIDEYVNDGSSDPLVPLSAFIEKHAVPKVTTTEVSGPTTTAKSVKATTKPPSEPSFIKAPSDKQKEILEAKVATAAAGVVAGVTQVVEKAKEAVTAPKTASPLQDSDFHSDKKGSDKKGAPNPTGTSVELTSETFTKLVTNTEDGWFIKFYAPWCGHCKAMAPAWIELANDSRDRLNIGEVNCEVESRLCQDIKVRGYPTLMFFQAEEHTEYTGLRGLGDLLAFTSKAAGAGIKDVDAAAFEVIQKKEEVIFLYFYDSASTSEDFEALHRTSLELIGHAPLLKTSSEILASKFRATTFPKLAVIRDGRPQYYNALGPADMRDHKKILAWMKSVWLPIVPELSPENSHEIMQNRIVVLAALNPDSQDFDSQKALLKSVAHEYTDQRASEEQADKQAQRDKKQTKIDDAEKKGDTKAVENAKGIQVKVSEHQDVGFAWVNGIFWEKWLAATYAIDVVSEGTKILINDEDKQRYWDSDYSGSPIAISKSGILDTLNIVVSNPRKITPKSTKLSMRSAYYAARRAGVGHPYIMGSLLVALLAAILLILTRGGSHGKKKHAISLGNSDRERGPFLGSNGKFD